MDFSPSPRRIALVVRGESFRSGHGQGDRDDHVTEESLQTQKEASSSHVDHVVKPLEDCGFEVHVFIATYGHPSCKVTSNATRDLVKWYGHRVKDTLIVTPGKKAVYTQAKLYGESLDLVSHYTRHHKMAYDGVLVLRHDIVMKKAITQLPEAQWQNVLLAFKELPFFPNRVADVMQWFPWRYGNCAVKCGWAGHHGDCLKEQAGAENFGFMMPGEHNTNTRAETNELYRLVRGTPHERHTVVLLACGRAFGPEGTARQEHLESALTMLGKSFNRHVIVPNNQHVTDESKKVDVISHCWAPSPQQAYKEAFKPLVAVFEKPEPFQALFKNKPGVGHRYWETVAWAFSAKRSLDLLKLHEQASGKTYDRVLFMRPDTLLLSDVDLDVIMLPADDPAFHSGSDLGSSAEFHLAMSRSMANEFGKLFETLSWSHPAQSFQWIKSYVEGKLNSTILKDDIVSGVDELAYWKLPSMLQEPCEPKLIARLAQEGFGEAERQSLGATCSMQAI